MKKKNTSNHQKSFLFYFEHEFSVVVILNQGSKSWFLWWKKTTLRYYSGLWLSKPQPPLLQKYSLPVVLKFHGDKKQLGENLSKKATYWGNTKIKRLKKWFRTNLYLYSTLVYTSVKCNLSFVLHKYQVNWALLASFRQANWWPESLLPNRVTWMSNPPAHLL